MRKPISSTARRMPRAMIIEAARKAVGASGTAIIRRAAR
jgi:hypothetical protein